MELCVYGSVVLVTTKNLKDRGSFTGIYLLTLSPASSFNALVFTERMVLVPIFASIRLCSEGCFAASPC